MTGTVFDIKEMAVHDGPGVRTTAFLKGCPLRCRWCHNPEGLTTKPQLMERKNGCSKCGECKKPCEHEDCKSFGRCLHVCPNGLLSISGKVMTSDELASELRHSAKTYGDGFGGITFSGGEPLLQWKFLLETAEKLTGINLCIETSGYADREVFEKVINVLDFVIMDIKLAHSEQHKSYTGVGNQKILNNFRILKASGKPFVIRTPLIPNITDTEDNLRQIKNIIGNSEWERLPYNKMAGAKYKMLNIKFPMDEI